MSKDSLFIKDSGRSYGIGLYKRDSYKMEGARRISSVEDAVKEHRRLYVSLEPLPEIEDEYYLVGGKRFELDNLDGAKWYAGKYAAKKGQRPRFELVTVYNRTYDRQDF